VKENKGICIEMENIVHLRGNVKLYSCRKWLAVLKSVVLHVAMVFWVNNGRS